MGAAQFVGGKIVPGMEEDVEIWGDGSGNYDIVKKTLLTLLWCLSPRLWIRISLKFTENSQKNKIADRTDINGFVSFCHLEEDHIIILSKIDVDVEEKYTMISRGGDKIKETT